MSTLAAADAATKSGSEEEMSVFGHRPGLFLLFFTEMWERFSYYGMRALLVLFLVSDLAAGGWGWARKEALGLYAWYTRAEEHTSELQSPCNLVCRLLL